MAVLLYSATAALLLTCTLSQPASGQKQTGISPKEDSIMRVVAASPDVRACWGGDSVQLVTKLHSSPSPGQSFYIVIVERRPADSTSQPGWSWGHAFCYRPENGEILRYSMYSHRPLAFTQYRKEEKKKRSLGWRLLELPGTRCR